MDITRVLTQLYGLRLEFVKQKSITHIYYPEYTKVISSTRSPVIYTKNIHRSTRKKKKDSIVANRSLLKVSLQLKLLPLLRFYSYTPLRTVCRIFKFHMLQQNCELKQHSQSTNYPRGAD